MGVWRVFRAPSPYNGVELEELDAEQSADVMYLAHIDHVPGKLLRYAHDDWEFQDVTFGPTISPPGSVNAVATVGNTDNTLGNGDTNHNSQYFPEPASYVVTSINDATAQESRASSPDSATNDLTLRQNYNTITWAAATDADRYYIYKSDNTRDYGYIGSTTATSFVDNNIGPDLTNGPPQGDNPFASTGDYPSTVTFFEQRLIWARTYNRPNAIFGSRSADFENMDVSRPLKDNDAFSLGLVAGRVNAVNQLVSSTSLLALASDAVFKIDGANEDGLITPQQVRARRQIGRGSARLSPLVIDNAVFYVPQTGPGVRTLGFSFEYDGLQSTDVSIFSPHFFDGYTITSWAYAQEPDSLIWAARSDGKLLCFTWQQEQQVWGWTLCETDGFVSSVCSISEGGEDRVYLIVRRTIDGAEKTFIERMASAKWDDLSQTCFLDCAVSFFDLEEATDTFEGLWHLEGETVWALADGSVVKDLVVENGTVTLPPSAGAVSNCTIGLPFTALIETLPLVVAGGATAGRRQQVGQAAIRLVESGAPRVGQTDDKLDPMKPRGDENWGEHDELFNGLYRPDVRNKTGEETRLVIEQALPLPLYLTAAYIEPDVSSPGG